MSDLAQLVNLGLGFALAHAVIAHLAANTPATALACGGGLLIALVAFTGWAWLGQGGSGLLVAATFLLYRQFRQEWS